MNRTRVASGLVALLLVFGSQAAIAGNTATGTHLVKTVRSYSLCVDDGVDAIFGWECSIVGFTPGRTANAAPGRDSGVRTTDANLGLASNACWLDCSSGQCCASFDFKFSSLRDIGTFQIDCDGLGVIPGGCVATADGCSLLCDFSLVTPYALSEPLHYFITVYNDPPSASPSHSPSPAWNANMTLSANSNDPDGGALSHTWSITSRPPGSTASLSGASNSSAGLQLSSDADIGTWSFQIHVDDNEGERVTFSHSFTVPNVPPNISLSGSDIEALDTLTVSASPTTDVDGGNLSFSWELLSAPATASRQPPGPGGWTSASVSFVTDEGDISSVDGSPVGE